MSISDEGYSRNVPDKGYSRNVPDKGYSRNVPGKGYSRNAPDKGYSRNVPDKGYSKNASCALNLIHMFLLLIWKVGEFVLSYFLDQGMTCSNSAYSFCS